MRVERANEEIKIRCVVGDFCLRLESRRLSFGRSPLLEGGDHGDVRPYGVVTFSVDGRRIGRANGGRGAVGWGDNRRRIRNGRNRCSGCCLGRLKIEGEQKEGGYSHKLYF